ncbi:hypothetical protein ANO11243_042360 [Dothideomycetidae sp. 11243]|nr:hypothetical protein ANO11243_042360 [fungal sp. No.11243]
MKVSAGVAVGLAAALTHGAIINLDARAPTTTHKVTTSHRGPATVQNTAMAMSSVIAAMASRKPSSPSMAPTHTKSTKRKTHTTTKKITTPTHKVVPHTTPKVTVKSGHKPAKPHTTAKAAHKASPTKETSAKHPAKTIGKAPPKTTKKPAKKTPSKTPSKKETKNTTTKKPAKKVAIKSLEKRDEPDATTDDPAATTEVFETNTAEPDFGTTVDLPTATTDTSATTSDSSVQPTISFDPSDPCGSLDYAYGYVPSDPSMAGFLSDPIFSETSLSAVTPSNYTWLYTGYYASLSQDAYMTYIDIPAYLPSTCSAWCDDNEDCTGFDIYYERDPSQNPALDCLNPSMETAIKCAFYNSTLDPTLATNVGQWRGLFGVVIAGGNGYNKGLNNFGPSQTVPTDPTTGNPIPSTIEQLTPGATYTSAPVCPEYNSTYYQSADDNIYLIECLIDHVGGDLSYAVASSLEACIDLCDGTEGCIDVSLSSETCYMKHELGEAVASDHVLGAKLVQSAEDDTDTSSATLSATTDVSSSTSLSTSTETTTTADEDSSTSTAADTSTITSSTSVSSTMTATA